MQEIPETKKQVATPSQDAVFEKKLSDIHRRKYLSNIRLLPDLRQKKSQEYLQVILTLIALIIASIFAIRPTLTTIFTLEQQVSDAQNLDDKLQAKANAISSLDAQYSALQSKLPTILEAIPKTEDAENLSAEIEGLAKTHNLQVTGLNVNPVTLPNKFITSITPPPTIQNPLSGLTMNVIAKGNYDDLRGFVKDIIAIQRMLTLEEITMTRSGQDETLSVTLSGTAYFLP